MLAPVFMNQRVMATVANHKYVARTSHSALPQTEARVSDKKVSSNFSDAFVQSERSKREASRTRREEKPYRSIWRRRMTTSCAAYRLRPRPERRSAHDQHGQRYRIDATDELYLPACASTIAVCTMLRRQSFRC